MINKLLCVAMLGLVNFSTISSYGQNEDKTFRDYQFSSIRVIEAYKKYNDTVGREFKKKNIQYPPKDIYLRAFKSQNELELWARNNGNGEYKLIKTYRICSISGLLGPKRKEGDRQVP